MKDFARQIVQCNSAFKVISGVHKPFPLSRFLLRKLEHFFGGLSESKALGDMSQVQILDVKNVLQGAGICRVGSDKGLVS